MVAITLNDAAKIAADNGQTKKAGIIAQFAEKSDLLGAMSFEGIAGNAVNYLQEGELPTVASRGIGESYVANAGTFTSQTDALYIYGGEVTLDRFIHQTQGAEVMSRYETTKVKALSVAITTALIGGSNATDPTSLDGLQTRITESTQLIDAGSTAGGAALSLKKLDLLIDSVESPTHLLMSRAMRRKFMAAFRSSTFPNIRMDKNDLGEMIISYGDLPILVGYPPMKNTQLLPFTEAASSGGATATSIYCVNLGEDGVVGISNGGISVRELGEQNDAPEMKTRIEWYLGLADYSPYARARLRYIGDLDIVA